MKFIELDYNLLVPNQKVTIPLGIILQSEDDLLFKFDLSENKIKKIKELNPNVDLDVLRNFENTFKSSYLISGVVITTDENGSKVSISVKEPRFLEYLNRTFQNAYRYSEPNDIQGDEPKKILDYLFQERILVA